MTDLQHPSFVIGGGNRPHPERNWITPTICVSSRAISA